MNDGMISVETWNGGPSWVRAASIQAIVWMPAVRREGREVVPTRTQLVMPDGYKLWITDSTASVRASMIAANSETSPNKEGVVA
jgi:flagellar basal body rod protein FlgF